MAFKKGTHWYNNGELEDVYFEGCEPSGYIRGRLPVKDETKLKISENWKNRSDKEKTEINLQRSSSWLKTYNSKTDLEKQEIVNTRVETMKNKSEEEKQVYRNKISEATKGKNKGKIPYNKGETKYTNESVMQTSIKVSNYMKEFNSKQSPEYFKEWRKKMRETMHLNGNASPKSMSSKEKEVYLDLCGKYGSDHVHYHNDGKIDPRYPYEVDFYVDTEDLFIEVQGHPSHGDHPYNDDSEQDRLLLEKLKKDRSNWSNMIISIWSKADVDKRNCAKQNNLNFLEIY